jgi:cytochrome c-type biogenesis protein CcmH/NrfG
VDLSVFSHALRNAGFDMTVAHLRMLTISRQTSTSRPGGVAVSSARTPSWIRAGRFFLTRAAPLSALLHVLATGSVHPQQSIDQRDALSGQGADTVSPADSTSTEERLRAAIRTSPDDPSAHAGFADFLLQEGRHAEAHTAYAEAVRLDPRNPGYRYRLASTALALERYAEAESQFAWGAQLDPTDPAMQVGLGEATLARGHPELAAPHFREAIELSDSATAVRAQAEALLLRATRASSDLSGQGWPGVVRRSVLYAAIAAMSVAGLALAVPIAEALLLVMVMAPVSALRRKS